jgi:riboflavin biosynthesis pyrimidine reductase
MRQLLPEPRDDVDLFDVYGRGPGGDGRPGVRLNMITSVDGATAMEGRAGGLAGPADRELFRTLRALTDVVLVGAGTVRDEHYGPGALSPELAARRAALGLDRLPPIAVVTRSCRLDWSSRLFAAGEQEPAGARPIVLTTAEAPADQRDRAAEAADVVVAGETGVEPARALAALADRGLTHVLLEGGPRLNAQFAAAGAVDEVCLSVAPLLVGGRSQRVVASPPGAEPGQPDGSTATDYALASVLEDAGYLFLRYCRAPDA